jgi:hypothetical protein
MLLVWWTSTWRTAHADCGFNADASHPERETPCPLRNRRGLQATPHQMRVTPCEDLGKGNPS